MCICFDNPAPMVADYATTCEGQPEFDFLTIVPTWWDETHVLSGQVGELLITARRRGAIWHMGGLSAKQPRELDLPLSFPGTGRYTPRIVTVPAQAKKLLLRIEGYFVADE